ncbi:C45 family autoproteolytic acyltransferase/hydrolase (plasmid) [Streptomyces xanthophaeus]|uniref:C45 family autoproteolytic acyltransferase/hydolase n=1 Tax=Streptomyces xanthophaeus TaxID=67385 RepID=UPI00399035FF
MSIAFVPASGTPRELGLAHGRALAAPLRGFLDDGLARLNHLVREPLALQELLPSIAAYRTVIEAALPDLAEEVAGLAEGAGISEDEAWLLQLRREVIGYNRVPTAGDCTTYARTAAAGTGRAAAVPVLAQTVDLNANLDTHISVLRIARAGSPRRSLVLSFAGLLGYLGLNSDGLAIGLNLVTDGQWRPGVSPYLAIRHLLDTASSVDHALKILAGLPLASSRSLMLCDRERAVYAEICGNDIRVTEPASGEAVHTNHYLHEDFAPFDRQTAADRVSSDLRLEAAARGLAGLAPDAGAEEHFAVLSRPPVCIPDHGNIRVEHTVAAAVLFPAEGRLHLRPGDPSRSATRVFTV